MTLKHLKVRDDGPKDRVAFTILNKPSGRFVEAFEDALKGNPAMKALDPQVRGSILEIALASHLTGVAEAFDEIVGRAIGMVEHQKEIAAQLRQTEESQRMDVLDKFKKNNGL